MSEENKHKSDLSSALFGGLCSFSVAIGSSAAVSTVALATVFGAIGGAYATGSNSRDLRRRGSIIGGVSGLAVYGATLFGAYNGYDQGSERSLTPFQTPTDSGIVVTRGDRTQVPFVFDEEGNLIKFSDVMQDSLELISEQNPAEYNVFRNRLQKREQAIYDSIKVDE